MPDELLKFVAAIRQVALSDEEPVRVEPLVDDKPARFVPLSEYDPSNPYAPAGRRGMGPAEAFQFATAITLKRIAGKRSCAPGRTRQQARESHGTRRGHRRRTRSASSSRSPDDPAGHSSLTLAPKPRAVYTFGVRAREVWGLE